MDVVLAFTLSLHAPGGPQIAPDKVKHFFLSAFVQSVSYSALRLGGVEHDGALVGASSATIAVGIGKEIRDSRSGGRFDVRDLAWGIAGGAAAAAVLESSRR
jgi:uncharacterized protein YfiM (DUF2279 family)